MKSKAQKILEELRTKYRLEKMTVEHYDEQANNSMFSKTD